MQGEVAHLGLRDDEARLIASLIELGFDAQPGRRSGVADQLDEGRAVSTILRQPVSAIYCSDSTVRMSAFD